MLFLAIQHNINSSTYTNPGIPCSPYSYYYYYIIILYIIILPESKQYMYHHIQNSMQQNKMCNGYQRINH